MKVIYKELNCYIPENLSTEDILCYNKRWHEKYIYFIHNIVYRSLRDKKTFNGYVNMPSVLLQHLLGSHYSKYIINQLVNSKIIEVNRSYSSIQHFSKSYRLTDKYRGASIVCTKIKKQTYCKKIQFMREKLAQDIFKNNPLLRHEFMNLSYRRIRVEEAIEYIDETYSKESPQYSSRLISIYSFDSMKDSSYSNNVYKYDFTFSYKGGRLYTPCSNLAKDLEKFTYFVGYEKESSVSLDMPNSQLCFFSKFINLHNIGREGKEGRENFAPTEKISSPLLSTPYVMQNRTWDSYIFNGLGYEVMMSLSTWRGKTEGHSQEERQQFKAEFFGQLFYNSYREALTDLERVFMFHFEAEAKALREVKEELGNRLLAVQVQTLEGKFFHVNIVAYMIQKRYFDIPFTIKHDSITLPSSQASFLIAELNTLVHEFFDRKDINFKFDVL